MLAICGRKKYDKLAIFKWTCHTVYQLCFLLKQHLKGCSNEILIALLTYLDTPRREDKPLFLDLDSIFNEVKDYSFRKDYIFGKCFYVAGNYF